MSADELARRLHDKATRGAVLSAQEQAYLEQWYARQDQEEGVSLARISPPQTAAALQAQVDAAVAQLVAVTQRIQALMVENEAVRQEVGALHRQLAQRLTTHPT